MNNKLKPASRLSVVFILVVVLSGSILTWFSINNISNQKVLTEKRIQEEQRELSSRFSEVLHKQIENVTAGFAKEITPVSLLKDSLIKKADEYDFIIQAFILKNNGDFLYPNFIENSYKLTNTKFSSRFKSAFSEGEKAEFVVNSLNDAKENYVQSLHVSLSSFDSVKALNALGRILVKIEEFENAIQQYNTIVLNYFNVSDENGVPYIYYAVPQLLKITTAGNIEKQLPIIEFCFEKMEMGEIPMNSGTKDWLTLSINSLQEITPNNLENLEYLNTLEKNILQQLQFVNEYRNVIQEELKKGGLNNHVNEGNDFEVVNSFSRNKPKLILINTNLTNPAGFLIDGERLFKTIVKTGLQSGFDFDYNIEFAKGYTSNTTKDNLVFFSQLNPYFPEQMIQIKLIDENLINNLIQRRSWIYGISTVLLLVAMVLGVALIVRDIAREKRLAQLQSDFISNVTHELKTPLTSISMFAESILLGRVKASKDKNEYLNIILKETERLKRMINNILDFSKREKGMIKYNFQKTDISALVKSALHDLDYWLIQENFNVHAKIEENVSLTVDPEALKQALINLLSNAIKYSRNTKEIIVILIHEKDIVKISVEDKGIGISEDKTALIFDKFYRIGQNKGDDTSGTGLGLTVVKEIIEAHKGEILVESKLNEGSKFTILLHIT